MLNYEALRWALVECPDDDLDVIDEEEEWSLVAAYWDDEFGNRHGIQMFLYPDGERVLVKEGAHGPDRELTNALRWWFRKDLPLPTTAPGEHLV